MQAIEKRVAALEQASHTSAGTVIFIHLVGMGELDKEIDRITHGAQEWLRHPDESEQALKDRAKREATPNPQGALMFLCY